MRAIPATNPRRRPRQARAQATGGIDLNERRVIRIEVPADTEIEFNWIAVPGAPGTLVTGYRWVLDPKDGDIFDETPRTTDSDFDRWSSWSLSELRWLTPKFPAAPGADRRG